MATPFKIENLWAYCSVGKDGDEGLIAATIDGTQHPLIGADETRVLSYLPYAKESAKQGNMKVVLRKFSTSEIVEVIEP